MYVRTDLGSYCEGFNDCGVILILYAMKSGIQGYQHPNPGADYVGGTSRAYLPDNKEGRLVLQLLKKAWQMKITHRVSEYGDSLVDARVEPNGIHLKSSLNDLDISGYPNPTYLQRVTADLNVMGVTLDL